MQHSQLRSINETVKLFAHVNPATVVKTLQVFKYKVGVITDITPSYTVEDLNVGYYSTEITTPFESCYLLILFCGNPIVLRVGDPQLQFFFHYKPLKTIPFNHFNEFGSEIESGILTELLNGFYVHGPISSDLGYIQVLNKPYIISVPYCDKSIQVAIAVVWSKKVIVQKFGTVTVKRIFSNKVSQLSFNLNTIKQSFTNKTFLNKFSTIIRKQNFKTTKC